MEKLKEQKEKGVGVLIVSISTARIPDAQSGDSRPSDIEQLLRDYGRAREEARTEIARARERLRERTEQEKRRLQQQVVSQEAKVQFLGKYNYLGFIVALYIYERGRQPSLFCREFGENAKVSFSFFVILNPHWQCL